jgi:hypothetical protein
MPPINFAKVPGRVNPAKLTGEGRKTEAVSRRQPPSSRGESERARKARPFKKKCLICLICLHRLISNNYNLRL